MYVYKFFEPLEQITSIMYTKYKQFGGGDDIP